MLIKLLETTHPKYRGPLWEDYRALYEGGFKFRDRVGHFLSQNPNEPAKHYQQRKREAVYRAYIGTVIDFFAAHLFTSPVTFTAHLEDSTKEAATPDQIALLATDVDGAGTTLDEFLKARFVDAGVAQSGWWVLDFPEAFDDRNQLASKEEFDKSDASKIKFKSYGRHQILDHDRDSRGVLNWVVIREFESRREDPEDNREDITHRWHVIDRERWRTFEIEAKATKGKAHGLDPDRDLSPVRDFEHKLGKVPVIELDVSRGLWIANRLESPQLEHFRLSSANNWSMRKAAYAMPIFMVPDPQNFKPTTMGASYFLAISEDSKAEYLAPPTAHLTTAQEEITNQKDELFRLVTQMALGVENNAASTGRSGASKAADAESMRIMLSSYGARVQESLKQALDLLSLAREDGHEYTVTGLESHETLGADQLLEMLKEALALGIDESNTFATEIRKRIVAGMLPGLDETKKKQIEEEIDLALKAADDALKVARSNAAGLTDINDPDDLDGNTSHNSSHNGKRPPIKPPKMQDNQPDA